MLSRLPRPRKIALLWAIVGGLITVALYIAMTLVPYEKPVSTLEGIGFKILYILNIVPLLTGAALSFLPWHIPGLVGEAVLILANSFAYGAIAWVTSTVLTENNNTGPPLI